MSEMEAKNLESTEIDGQARKMAQLDKGPDFEKLEKAILEKAKAGKQIVLDLRSGTKIDEVVESLLKKKELLKGLQESDSDVLEEYKKNQEALIQRNKEYTELRLKEREERIEAEKIVQERKAQAQKLLREEKQAARGQLNAERRQKHQTAVALEDCLSNTRRQYEEALAQRNVIQVTVSKLEVKAKNAAKESREAEVAFERAKRKFEEAMDKRLRCDGLVLMAKSPKLDSNISSLREKLKTQSTQVHDAWQHVNPKKRRKELMNNVLRKQVRDLLK